MNALPAALFENPVLHALQTRHLNFAVSNGDACRYPGDVVPFAAVRSPSAQAMHDLHPLLAPGESVWLMGQNFPLPAELTPEETLDCFQMVIPETVASPASQTDIVPLSRADSHDMVALTTLAFPGFFRERTCEMGTYYGVRSNEGELIAMGGERLRLHHFSEVSGVCTHPYHRGKGLAAAIIWQLIRQHRRDGTVSWLHVGCANANAIELYHRMGFDIVRKLILTRIRRKPATLLEIPPPNDY